MSFVDSLYPLVITGDAVGARDLLAGLEGKELFEAKAWFAKATRWHGNIDYRAYDPGTDSDVRHARWGESHRVMALCAIELCGPVTAARRLPWDQFWEHQTCVGDQLLLDAVCAKDADWVAEFVEAASHRSGRTLGRILRSINASVPVPCPTGSGYSPGWTGYRPPEELADEMAADPWMPDVLLHVLDFGWAASWENLPGALAILTSSGLLDRSRVLTHILRLLTSPQKPGSQQALVRILAAVGLRDEELPGVDYVLGVMATTSGAVGKYLLPAALRMVTADDLPQLVGVIVARSEKAQKEMLLRGLKDDLVHRMGVEPVVEALRVLATEADATISGRANAALAELAPDADAATPPDPVAILGLWDMTPQAPPPPAPGVDESWVNWTLRSLAAGDRSSIEFQWSMLEIEANGDWLSPSRYAADMPELFINGAMSDAWPLALAMADLCCTRLKRPAGLPQLLRVLVQFAPEAPPQELPRHLARLAAGRGSATAQMEARALGAALARTDVDVYIRNLRVDPIPAPSVRGLWKASAAVGPRRTDRLDAISSDLIALRREASREYGASAAFHAPHCDRVEGGTEAHAWHADLVLDATVRAVGRFGADAVREALVGIERPHDPLGTIEAIDMWAAGLLTHGLFWRVARSYDSRHRWRTDRRSPLDFAEDWEKKLLLPEGLSGAAGRVTFLRAAECLMLADQNPVVLATPTYADGTIDMDDLLSRLATVQGLVALLDVIQALYRLRPCDPQRAEDVPSGIFSDPSLSSADGDQAVSASGLVREWVTGGGVGQVHVVGVRNVGTTVDQPTPFDWTRAEASPVELKKSNYQTLGVPSDVLTVFPQWPILGAFQYAFGPPDGSPLDCCGPYAAALAAAWRDTVPEGRRDVNAWMDAVSRLDQAGRLAVELAGPMTTGYDLDALTWLFRAMFEGGALAATWDIAVASIVCRLTSGLGPDLVAEFLRMLTGFAHEVPEPYVPEQLRAYASERGNDVVLSQARLLVAALERSRL